MQLNLMCHQHWEMILKFSRHYSENLYTEYIDPVLFKTCVLVSSSLIRILLCYAKIRGGIDEVWDICQISWSFAHLVFSLELWCLSPTLRPWTVLVGRSPVRNLATSGRWVADESMKLHLRTATPYQSHYHLCSAAVRSVVALDTIGA